MLHPTDGLILTEGLNRKPVTIGNEIDFSNDLQPIHRWEEKQNFCPPQVVVIISSLSKKQRTRGNGNKVSAVV